jgi:large subunit ribosomal protein L17
MRHLKHHQSLGVTREHRAALLSNLAAALITHGRIETTLTKARALRPFIEKIITKAKRAAAASEKKDAIHLRRHALRKVRNEDAITLLFNEKAAQFSKRPGGYTRIYKLAPRRVGDSAEMALIEFVGAEDPGYKKRGKRSSARQAEKTEAPAAEPSAETATPAADATKEQNS